MKKFLISFIFIASFGTYAWYNYSHNASLTANAQSTAAGAVSSDSGVTIVTPSPTDTTTQSSSNTSAPASAPPTPSSNATASQAAADTATKTTVVAPAKKSTGQYVDGTYTGSTADAYYGNIQVKVTISGGKLTNVVFLQSPNDRSTSRMINQQAMPMLKAEAIQAQSANVDGVSGASDSSAAFQQSLASALAQAKA